MKHLTTVVVITMLALTGCDERTIVIDTDAVRADFAKKGWIPTTLPLGSTLTWDIDTNRCTIQSPSLPRGFEANEMREGAGHWRITSTPPAPIVIACER